VRPGVRRPGGGRKRLVATNPALLAVLLTLVEPTERGDPMSALRWSCNVHHLPPGTNERNKIEHRLFSYISQNWRAKPLVSYIVTVDPISATTETGLAVLCELHNNACPKGSCIVVSDEEIGAINLPAPISAVNGTAPSTRATDQIELLIPDKPEAE
jgi:hypothetical protein